MRDWREHSCGALRRNARAGLVGVLGLPGAVVPANGMELRKSAIRGVESNGMMCSSRELELGDDHDGIIELPADAPIGASFADYSGAGDPVIDISITPNRQDCMGVRGIARDLAAAGLGTLKPLDVPTMTMLGTLPWKPNEVNITGIAESANPCSSGSVNRLVFSICGIISASITIRKMILALNKMRLNKSTEWVPIQTTPPATSVNSNTPSEVGNDCCVHWLILVASNSPAPLI